LVLATAWALSSWYPLSVLILLLAQATTTILIHCPAHYIVGRAVGIRFRAMRLGRTTAVRLLPKSMKRLGSLIVVFTLAVEPASKRGSAPSRLRAMYLAGVTASVGSAVTLAYVASLGGNLLAGAVTWTFALAYLASDVFFSPRAGDLMRARAAMMRNASA
jgi:hypothetical protein